MKLGWYILFLVAVLAVSSCERRADVAKPKTYTRESLAFEYPRNWRVTKDQALSNAGLVEIEAPGNAVALMTIFPENADVNLRRYAETILRHIEEKVPIGTVDSGTITQNQDAIDLKYSMTLLGVKVPHSSCITLHRFQRGKVICFTQVADEDRRLVQPGFDLIRKTLRSSDLKPGQGAQPSLLRENN
jgi:hypothetical protein